MKSLHSTHALVLIASVSIPAVLLETQASAVEPTVGYLYPGGVAAGQEVVVTAAVSGLAWPPRVRVEGAGGEEVAGLTATPLDDEKKVRVRAARELPPGRYWLRFHGDEGAASPRPFLVGQLAEQEEAEPNDTLEEAESVEGLPRVVNGRLAKNGETDAFAVILRAGDTLVAVVEANRVLGSPMDASLQVTDSAGFVLDENDDELGLDPRLTFRAPSDGRYVVRVFAFPAAPNSSIRFSGDDAYVYRLTLTTTAYAAYAQPLAVTCGAPSEVRLCGWNLTDDGSATVRVPPAPAAGLRLLDPGRAAGLVEVLIEPHTTLVEGQPHGNGFVQPVELPSTISGRVARPGDLDHFGVELAEGERLIASVHARRLSSRLDAVLRIRSDDDEQLAEVDDRSGADPEIEFKAPRAGRYVIEVGDRFGQGGPFHVYALRLVRQAASFSLHVADDHFRLEPGKPLELPVSVRRVHGFDREVTLGVEGLPAEIRVAPAVSTPSGEEAKKVSLQLDGSGERWSGPIRVIGESAGAEGTPAIEAVAFATLIGPGGETSVLWLTAVPPPPPAEAADADSE